MSKEMKKQLHPVMERLGLGVSKKGKVDTASRDVLNYLLQKNLVKETDVQAAYDYNKKEKETQKSVSALQNEQSQTAVAVKNKKEDQPTRNYRTRHIALQFYYDGADYSGLAENIGMDADKSVEKALFQALLKTRFVTTRGENGYSRCGRTDKGVSSAGQVVAMQLKSNIALNASWDEAGEHLVTDADLPKNGIDTIRIWTPPKKGDGPRVEKDVAEFPYDKIVNNVLPGTIRILGWCPVSTDFSARFSASTRTYRYFFVKRPGMDLTKMREALQYLKGKHDFRNLCKMDVEKVYNFERLIHDVQLITTNDNNVCYFQILGQAFLWHQIRCIVSILFMVGRGQEEPSIVTELLAVDQHPGKPSYALAPERPLVLHQCGYHDLQLGYSTQNLWATSCELERQWEELVLAAARVRNCIESMKELDVMRKDLVQFGRAKIQEVFKKQQRYTPTSETMESHLATLEEGLESGSSENNGAPVFLTWEQALLWLNSKNLIVSPEGVRASAHEPLIQRSKGTTYEEKVDALSQSKRRQARYDENVVKKRKTKEEDKAFYDHMASQGGSAS
jgi:tRNA pseudouridine38/39 synthase